MTRMHGRILGGTYDEKETSKSITLSADRRTRILRCDIHGLLLQPRHEADLDDRAAPAEVVRQDPKKPASVEKGISTKQIQIIKQPAELLSAGCSFREKNF